MPLAAISATSDDQRTFASSFITIPSDNAAFWPFAPADSFIRIRSPRRRSRAPRAPRVRLRARTKVKRDAWPAMAGGLAVVADVATQGASAARRHDAAGLDRLMLRVREALLDMIALHNTDEAFAKKG